MNRAELLKQRQAHLKADIQLMLDRFLVGTVAKSPSMLGYNLTTKVKGKTVTLYVRKNLVPPAVEMSRTYAKMWQRIQQLSKLNWELLKLESE